LLLSVAVHSADIQDRDGAALVLDQRTRALARDFERYARTVAAFIRLAMIRIMLRRLTKATGCA
jgi:hypothetical protein